MSWSKVKAKIFSKKAISPIIATLLLIVMAVAAAAIAWVFISGILRPPTAPGVYPSASLTVESCSGSTGTAVLKLLNTGDVALNITDIRITDRSTGTSVTPTSVSITIGTQTWSSTPAGPLDRGQNAYITITAGFTTGHIYRFTITILANVPGGGSTDVVAEATAQP